MLLRYFNLYHPHGCPSRLTPAAGFGALTPARHDEASMSPTSTLTQMPSMPSMAMVGTKKMKCESQAGPSSHFGLPETLGERPTD